MARISSMLRCSVGAPSASPMHAQVSEPRILSLISTVTDRLLHEHC
jgi:hypothetical protein